MKTFTGWAKTRPIVIINLVFIIFGVSLFAFQMVRTLDVLDDWHISLSPVKEYRVVNGERLAVIHPNESMVFTSTSRKLIDSDGTITRTLVCDATEELREREILLDTSPASKKVGFNPERASSIIIPDVVQFNKLPRVCRLVIDIIYDVPPFRTHSEHAETERFIVEETRLSATQLREEIDRLNALVKKLESQLQSDVSIESNDKVAFSPNTNAPTQNKSQPQQSNPEPSREDTTSNPEPENSNVVSRVLDGVTGTVNGVVGGVRVIIGL